MILERGHGDQERGSWGRFDTQINTRVIYQYDTIVNTVYKNILIEEILQNQPYNPSNSAFATVNAKTFDTNFLVPRIRSGSYSNLFTEKSPLEAAFLRQGIGLQLLNANLPDEVSEEEQSAFLSEMLADIQALKFDSHNASWKWFLTSATMTSHFPVFLAFVAIGSLF